MECIECKAKTFRRVKGFPVCRNCISNFKAIRDHLNSTRKNPQSKINPMGEVAVTMSEVLFRKTLDDAQKTLDNQTNETVEVTNESI